MTKPLQAETPERVLLALDEDIERAAEDAKESSRVAMNSYGAGYDAGFLEGLKRARAIIRGDDE